MSKGPAMPVRDANPPTATAARKRQFGDAHQRRRTALAALAVLVAVNAVGLGIYLLRGTFGLGDTSGSTATTRDAADVNPSFAPGVPQVRGDRLFADVNESGFAVRARAGDCASASGTAEQSTDGGATWLPVPVLSVVVVHAIEAGGGAQLPTLVGSTADCQPRRWQTLDRGVSWQLVDGPVTEWFLLPDSPTTVQTPVGDEPSPCPPDATVVDVREAPARAGLVTCSNGLIMRSFDNGEQWREFGRVEGIASASFSGDTGFAAAGGPGCAGVQILRGVSSTWTEIACVPGAEPAGAGVVVRGDVGMLFTFNGTWLTRDGGLTWSPA